jgi:YHS domain-containing protein
VAQPAKASTHAARAPNVNSPRIWELAAAPGVDNDEWAACWVRRPRSGTRRQIVNRFLGLALAATLLMTSVGGALAAKNDKEEMVVCPVLKQKIPKSKAIKVVHNGKTYYVCCDSCAEQIKSGKVK